MSLDIASFSSGFNARPFASLNMRPYSTIRKSKVTFSKENQQQKQLIKIDMQFLKDSERNSKVGYIIESIIDMSKKIGVDTLIEGVETAKQFERLYAMGCKLYQGFYFSKPVDLESFEKQWFD